MRWLIFVLLISCGKHEEPKKMDLRDSDGDQIVNAYESDINKYIANIEPMGKVSGTLRFQHLEQIEMSFSNQFKTVNEVMVGPDQQTGNKNYLSEGTQIKVSGKIPSIDFKQESYVVKLTFDEISSAVQEVFLISGDEQRSLGKWEPQMNVKIHNKDLKALITGNAHMTVSKKYNRENYYEVDQDESVRDNTYRVFINDGKKSEILYVSKELPIEKLKESFKINNVLEVKEDEFFFYHLETDSVRWYQRDFANGDRALVYSSLEELNKVYKERFQIKKINLSRDNGYATNNLVLNNSKLSPVFFVIRASKVMRDFHESTTSRLYVDSGGGGRDGGGVTRYSCTYYLRDYINKPVQQVSFEEVLGNIQMVSGNNVLAFDANNIEMEEGSDEKGIFWKLKVNWQTENIKLQILNNPASSFTTTGQYHKYCEGNGRELRPAVSTNMEAKFSLEIESYVEKIN
ncbi:hypothetical protein ACJVC5_07310 [Peredibacter sp. HCB2-198]|uniref:hypothetical protein n=1 Tax=Peredibacter sp. HCB2-198 TaxID=3383025 RepID=UPI0038B61EEF